MKSSKSELAVALVRVGVAGGEICDEHFQSSVRANRVALPLEQIVASAVGWPRSHRSPWILRRTGTKIDFVNAKQLTYLLRHTKNCRNHAGCLVISVSLNEEESNLGCKFENCWDATGGLTGQRRVNRGHWQAYLGADKECTQVSWSPDQDKRTWSRTDSNRKLNAVQPFTNINRSSLLQLSLGW